MPRAQRQLAALERADVAGPLGLVLIVHARDVPEAGHAGGQQIAAVPQIVAVAEVHLVLVFDQRVGARHAVAGGAPVRRRRNRPRPAWSANRPPASRRDCPGCPCE